MAAIDSPGQYVVERAVRGDQDATADLLALVRPGIVRYCRAHLGRAGSMFTTADDVAQDVCVAIVAALPSYRDMGRPFAAFVYGIAAHKVSDARRASARYMVVSLTDTRAERPDRAPGPYEQAVASE